MGKALTKLQFGMETTNGTPLAAAFQWPGEAEIDFGETIETPHYMTGIAGRTIEQSFVSSARPTLTLKDTPLSAELMAYLGQISIKKIAGVAATTFAYTFPTTAANAIASYTWEFAVAGQVTQEYEFAYGFCPNFSISGDCEANNAQVFVNAVIRGYKASASTVTSSLALIANHEPLSMANANIKIDAVGTAAGTAAATAGFLKAFSLDVETGWYPGMYADGRTNKDMSLAEGGGTSYKLTGNLKCLLNATGVTELANARAGTGRIIQVNINGSSNRVVQFDLPMTFTSAPKIGDQEQNGLWLVSFPFDAGYSSTATAQGPAIDVTLSAALQIYA